VTQNDDNWDEIFRPTSGEPRTAARPPADSSASSVDPAPLSRRAAREARDGRPAPRRTRRRWPWILSIVLVVLLAGTGGGAWYVWTNFEPQVRELLGWELPNDYEGSGNGTEVLVTINNGDIGSDVATTLAEQGVTMTFDALYDLLLADSSISFIPGTYQLEEEMSAQSALDALLDPANRIELSATVREGLRAGEVIEALSAGTGIPLEDYEAAIADPSLYGIPEIAPNIEGYMFPATYRFEPGTTAEDHVRTLVNEMFRRLDAAGVAEDDRHTVLTKASLIQREARLADDFYRVSRVIENRLADDWLLQFDSASQYGTGETGSVWSSGDALGSDNPYNTYAIPGLPIGPIAAPGDVAIDAVLNPAEGDWFYFVTVNLATGETRFSQTIAEHEAGVAELRAWCRASEENRVFCA